MEQHGKNGGVSVISRLKEVIKIVGWRFPFIRVVASRKPVVLMYHNVSYCNEVETLSISAECFEKHVALLKKKFHLIHPDELESERSAFDKIRVLLTFDDGNLNNADVVVPILRKYNAPALFFVSSRHVKDRGYLWPSYLQSLATSYQGSDFQFRGQMMDTAPAKRKETTNYLRDSLLELEPHPSAIYDVIEREFPPEEDFFGSPEDLNLFAGMTPEQISELAADPLFCVGVHTVDHPFLSKCETEEIYQQIHENKKWLESICNQKCEYIAYPHGDYDERVLKISKDLGLKKGFAVIPTLNKHPQFEALRIGVYSPSINHLGFISTFSRVVYPFL